MARLLASLAMVFALATGASAASLEVNGGTVSEFGGTPSSLTGTIELSEGLISLDLNGGGMAISGDLATEAVDADTFGLVAGQYASFGGGQSMITGTCDQNGGLICNFTAVGAYTGVINDLSAATVASSPMPEPGSAALFGLGGILVGWAVRRKDV